MPAQDGKKSQTLLENWFKKPKSAHATADKVDHATTDDEEGRTLPPASEPDSEVERETDDEKDKKKRRSGKATKVVEDDDMEEDIPKKTKAVQTKKLLVVDESEKPVTKGRKPRTAGTTRAKSGTKKTTTKARPRAKAKNEGSDEEIEEDEDVGSDDGVDVKYKSKAHPEDLKLPPLSTMPLIFKDIVARNPKLRDVSDLFQKHNERYGTTRKLRVGTMCSGTESPLLALQLISEAMELDMGSKLDVEHIFSCEIEPFKQAYIERNFRPPILFRDVTELGGDEAYVHNLCLRLM